MLKDIGLATEAAKQPAFMGALAQQFYPAMSSRGDGKLDFSAVSQAVSAGVKRQFAARGGRRAASGLDAVIDGEPG